MKQIPLVCADWNVVSTRSEWLNNRHTDLCLLSLGKSWCESHINIITFRVCQRHAEALQLRTREFDHFPSSDMATPVRRAQEPTVWQKRESVWCSQIRPGL